MNTITIELCPEDRNRLDTVIDLLCKLTTHNCHSCVQTAVQTAVAIAKDPDTAGPALLDPAEEHPADASTAHLTVVEPETPAAAEQEAPKPIEFEDFRGRVAKYLAGGGDKAALKAYLEENFGTGQVSAVPQEKRADVLEHFNA